MSEDISPEEFDIFFGNPKDDLTPAQKQYVEAMGRLRDRLLAIARKLPGYTNDRDHAWAYMDLLGREYGFTPEQIRKLTPHQLIGYAESYLAKQAREATPSETPGQEAGREPAQIGLPEQISPVTRAIATMMDCHKRTGKIPKVEDLALAVGIKSRATLYRDPRFRAARKALRAASPPVKGHRDRAGNIDVAIAEEDPD